MAISEMKVGDLAIDGNGGLWRCVSRAELPTMHLERVDPPAAKGMQNSMSGVTTAPIFHGLTRLVPEGK